VHREKKKHTENTEVQQIIFILFNPSTPPKPRVTTNHTNSTNKKNLIFYVKKQTFLIYLCDLCYLLLKNGLWGGTIKNFVSFVVNMVLIGTLFVSRYLNK